MRGEREDREVRVPNIETGWLRPHFFSIKLHLPSIRPITEQLREESK